MCAPMHSYNSSPSSYLFFPLSFQGTLPYLLDRELPITDPLAVPNVEAWKRQYAAVAANKVSGENMICAITTLHFERQRVV